MAKSPRHAAILVMEDQGALLLDAEGAELARAPEMAPGPQRRQAWAQALRGVLGRNSELRVVLGQSALALQCQEVPYLGPAEAREAARRLGAAEGGGTFLTGSALEADPEAQGGHVLWVGALPSQEMHDLVAVADDLGLKLVQAAPWARILWRGLGTGPAQPPRARMVLAVHGGLARLLVLQGPALVLQRAFRVGEEEDEDLRLERIYQELARTLQFVKQRQRGFVVEQLLTLGLPGLPPAFLDRLRGLKLQAEAGPEDVWPLLKAGLDRERKGGLNLVPEEVLEAQARRFARIVLWSASMLVVALMGAAWAWFRWSETQRAQEADRMEATLAQRKALQAQRHEVVGARVPLLRLRLAEARQMQALQSLGRLGALLLEAPEGVALEKVEIQEAPGEPLRHRFLVQGTALTDPAFAAGPLAVYLGRLQALQGLQLDPMREVQLLDRREEGDGRLDQRAVARFTLEGSAP